MDCKKSLFMKSSQDTPEDAASAQAQLARGRTVLSPATLGQGLRKGLEGVPKKQEEEIGEDRLSCLQTSQST